MHPVRRPEPLKRRQRSLAVFCISGMQKAAMHDNFVP